MIERTHIVTGAKGSHYLGESIADYGKWLYSRPRESQECKSYQAKINLFVNGVQKGSSATILNIWG